MTTYRIFDVNRASRDFSTQFFDFHGYTAADWVVTLVGTTPTVAVVDGVVGGALLLTEAATDNSQSTLQYAGVSGAVKREYAWTAGKKLQFTSRVQASHAVQSDVIAGLMSVSTDPIGTPPTDGIFFRKDDETARWWFVARKAGVETKLDTQTDMVAATNYDLEFYYDGSHSTIAAYINQVKVGSLPTSALPTAFLALSFGAQNGDANSRTFQFDFVGAQQQR